jgi:uncharacterized protein (TIGR00369 family)
MSIPARLLAQEPVRGVYGVPPPADMPALDFLQGIVRGHVANAPFCHLTGVWPVEFGAGTATFTLPITPWLQNGAGFVEPGIVAFLADAPLSTAILAGLGPGRGLTTSELSVTYVQPITRGTSKLVCRASTMYSTKTAAVSTAEVTDAEGRLLAHASTRCVMFDIPTAPAGTRFPAPATYESPDPYLRPVEGDIRPPEVWNALSGMEILNGYVAGEFSHFPTALLFGTDLGHVADGEVTVEMTATPWHCGGGGTLYGGMIALLTQAAMESAVLTTLPAGTLFATLDLTVHFIRPIFPGDGLVSATATVDHRGRLVRVASARVLDPEGRTAALARASVMVVPDGMRRMLRGEFPWPAPKPGDTTREG